MDPQQIDWFRGELQRQRDEALAGITAHTPASTPLDDREGRDPEDEAARATSRMVEIRIARDHENLVRKIDLALRRLDAGTYEECARCGATIPMERLLAKPSVSLCIPCQQAKDAGEWSEP